MFRESISSKDNTTNSRNSLSSQDIQNRKANSGDCAEVMDGVCQCNPDTGIHAKRTHRLDRFLGCKARLWKVGARCYFDDWFWEAEKGKTLTWTDPSQGVNWENL